MQKITFGRYTVTITHPEKILFPPDIIKQDLIKYYAYIAPVMLPYIYNRPVMMHRFPDGIYGESFYQKDASAYFPSWIKQVLVPKQGGFNNYILCQNQATLVYIANQACITPHIWLSRIDKLDYPDHMIFDLDPAPTTPFTHVCLVAQNLKVLLEDSGLTAFVMTTGSHGLHVLVPLKRLYMFEQVKAAADYYAQELISRYPEQVTTQVRKEKRENKIFIDTLRNQYAATSVAPYAVRAKPNAPVATPLYWHELQDPTLTAQRYTIQSIVNRLASIQDPWKNFHQAQTLKKLTI